MPPPPPPPPGSSVRESAFLASSIRYTLRSRQQITGDVSRLWQNGGKHIGNTLASGNSDTSTPSATSQQRVNLQNSDDEIRETRGSSRKVKFSIPKRDTIIQPNSRMPCFRSGELPYICMYVYHAVGCVSLKYRLLCRRWCGLGLRSCPNVISYPVWPVWEPAIIIVHVYIRYSHF
jgi:hypothetical protein